ncbi:MAG TPA: hypothetical protein VEK57_03125, partial [Thermoanaerobaculia bacterium]|nr:hypothetical protein [Thermoanaerobaculia bacterium]
SSVIDSVHAIATGSIGGAIKKVETALGNAVPILIGFLARLIGLGGISQKVRDFITKVRAKVDAAIDKVLKKIVDAVKKLLSRLLGRGGARADQRSDADKRRDVNAAVAAGTALLRDRTATAQSTRRKLPPIKSRYKLTRLEVVKVGGTDARETDRVVGEINPKAEGPEVVIDAGDGVTLAIREEEKAPTRITDPARMLPPASNPTVITDPARLLPAGRPTTRTMAQAANVRGTGKERGSALEEYVHEMAGGQREVTVQTPMGARRHDVGNVPRQTQTEMAYEAKNYLRWVTVNSVKVEKQVPLNTFIRSEIDRDFLWMRAGRRLTPPVHRVVQWVFGGAHPSPELAALLSKRGIPYVTRG